VDEIGKVLPALFKKQIGRSEPHLLDILVPLWPRIVGRIMAEHSQPAAFASGLLTLNTDSATWAVQLRHMTEEIRGGVNKFLGQAIVKKLRIKAATGRSLFASPRPVGRIASPARPQAEESMNTDSITDPEIAAALANSFAKYFNRPGRA
jgi:predicted nucleic acid-binding Zn ribbon protein